MLEENLPQVLKLHENQQQNRLKTKKKLLTSLFFLEKTTTEISQVSADASSGFFKNWDFVKLVLTFSTSTAGKPKRDAKMATS